jgi:hypothetical protein
MKKRLLFFAIWIICAIQLVSASHYIIGIVNNALEGETANGKEVVLWNPTKGIDKNVTDIIGLGGNSGADNIYLIDCEMLATPCKVNDEVRVKVLNKGDDYISYWVNLSVTGAGYDLAPNITLNSIPNSSIISPVNYHNDSDEVAFSCSASDLDGLGNITLYGNWSGEWHANETKSISGMYNSTTFTKNITEGKYLWGCLATDNVSISNFSSQNFTITIDRTPPVISSISVNMSQVCGNSWIRVNCTVQDSLTGISRVIIEARGPLSSVNYSASLLEEGVYYSDIFANEIGEWTFNCISNDSVGNIANLTSLVMEDYSSLPDLLILPSEINFSNHNPIENEPVIIESVVHNIGCSDAGITAGFYIGDPGDGNQINGNRTVLVPGLSNKTINVTWDAEIGMTNIFVFADINNSVSEQNESNNQGNKTINVGAWQVFYGNISADKLLGSNLTYNLTFWENISDLQGSIFVTDKESEIAWGFLQAIGRDKEGSPTSDDFSGIDSILGMSSFSDSVYNLFTEAGIPKDTATFQVHGEYINNVAIINSTNNSNFLTGILWDSFDDVDDGEFSGEDKEDLVFVAKINKGAEGLYGNYDYEINIPVRLREYDENDKTDVYLYYDIY